MAARNVRGKELALQVEIESQEDWEEAIGKEGLTVVDVYQEWCGPCKAMIANFKRMKNEIGDDLLYFVTAKADSIESLERYRGKCEPCFLFYASGVLVAVIRGANSPALTRVITEQLVHERKVLEGAAERREIRDPKFPNAEERKSTRMSSTAAVEESESSESEDEDDEETQRDSDMLIRGERVSLGLPEVAPIGKVMLEKMITVAIIEPEVLVSHKLEEIVEKLQAVGIDILEQTERQLTIDEVKQLYSSRSDEEDYPDMCIYMSSGPSQILVLTKGNFGEGIVEEWQEIIGPPVIADAKSIAPTSLRALYGNPENTVARAFHGSASIKDTKRELRLFFPDFVIPKVSLSQYRPPQQQRTVAVIRPDAVGEHKDTVLEKILAAGLKIVMQKEMRLEREQAESFYKHQAGEPFYEELVSGMSSGPLLALVLEKEDAVETWKGMLGPKDVDVALIESPDSLRAQCAVPNVAINQLHGSDSEEHVPSEIAFFFPLQHTLAVIKPDVYHLKEIIMLRIREAGFNVIAQKDALLTSDIADRLYRHCRDKEYFTELIEFMTSGPTSFLILLQNEAVSSWKECIGPTDPDVAKETAPKSLRAMFGTSILSNAIHGPSNVASAADEIKLVFGDVEFDDRGHLKKKKKQKKVSAVAPCVEEEEAPSLSALVEEEDDKDKPEPPDADWPSKLPVIDSQSEDVLVEPVDFIMPYDEIDPWKKFMLKSETGIKRSEEADRMFWQQFKAGLPLEEGELDVDEYEGLSGKDIWLMYNAKARKAREPYCRKVFHGWLEEQRKKNDEYAGLSGSDIWHLYNSKAHLSDKSERHDVYNGWLEKYPDEDDTKTSDKEDAHRLSEPGEVDDEDQKKIRALAEQIWMAEQDSMLVEDDERSHVGWLQARLDARLVAPVWHDYNDQLSQQHGDKFEPPFDGWTGWKKPEVEAGDVRKSKVDVTDEAVSVWIKHNQRPPSRQLNEEPPYEGWLAHAGTGPATVDENVYAGWLEFGGPAPMSEDALQDAARASQRSKDEGLSRLLAGDAAAWVQYQMEAIEPADAPEPPEVDWPAKMAVENKPDGDESDPALFAGWLENGAEPRLLESASHYEGWLSSGPRKEITYAVKQFEADVTARRAETKAEQPSEIDEENQTVWAQSQEEPLPAGGEELHHEGWLENGEVAHITESVIRAEEERLNKRKDKEVLSYEQQVQKSINNTEWNEHNRRLVSSTLKDMAERRLAALRRGPDEFTDEETAGNTAQWDEFNKRLTLYGENPSTFDFTSAPAPGLKQDDFKLVEDEGLLQSSDFAALDDYATGYETGVAGATKSARDQFDGWLSAGPPKAITNAVKQFEDGVTARQAKAKVEQPFAIDEANQTGWVQSQEEPLPGDGEDLRHEGWPENGEVAHVTESVRRDEEEREERRDKQRRDQDVLTEKQQLQVAINTAEWDEYNRRLILSEGFPKPYFYKASGLTYGHLADGQPKPDTVTDNVQQPSKKKSKPPVYDGWLAQGSPAAISPDVLEFEDKSRPKTLEDGVFDSDHLAANASTWEEFNKNLVEEAAEEDEGQSAADVMPADASEQPAEVTEAAEAATVAAVPEAEEKPTEEAAEAKPEAEPEGEPAPEAEVEPEPEPEVVPEIQPEPELVAEEA